ncbi:MAG: hypothetical protein EBR82_77770 [Caulobacteraceae bacterium]|nr:hypothetical protein [Caulobacteraceae bacterium]
MKCPFCGAEARTERRFQCWTTADMTERSGTCMERENESLKARIARLIKAGDALRLDAGCQQSGCQHDDAGGCPCVKDIVAAWDAAKEAKP